MRATSRALGVVAVLVAVSVLVGQSAGASQAYDYDGSEMTESVELPSFVDTTADLLLLMSFHRWPRSLP